MLFFKNQILGRQFVRKLDDPYTLDVTHEQN